MIKKLDILVLKAFIGPFIATFFLTLFVLILQFFWLWIDDIVGKGLDAATIFKLIGYLSATLVPLALPLAVLLSSIMTFGNLGETFELVAIKSAGIGLLRFMRPLLVVAILLSVLAFLFNNYMIPVANLKMRALQTDIVNKKPAFDLKEGVFYTNIPGYAIKVAKKENDSTLDNVIIYEPGTGMQDNMIVAKSGVMRVSKDKRFLELTLKDGWLYQEQGGRAANNSEFIRLGFRSYEKAIDLSALQLNITADSVFKNRYEMLSIRQLNHAVDSLEKIDSVYKNRIGNTMRAYLPFLKNLDSNWVQPALPKDTAKTFTAFLPDSARHGVLEQTISAIGSIKSVIETNMMEYQDKRKSLRLYLIEWHNKFTMSVAVLVLFLIGAPLGSIVRKGGIGTPVVFAVIFFVIFFLLNNFGRKFVQQDVMQPLTGMWMATAVLVPIGLFLIYKAMNDSQLFNKEFYFRVANGIRRFTSKIKARLRGEQQPS